MMSLFSPVRHAVLVFLAATSLVAAEEAKPTWNKRELSTIEYKVFSSLSEEDRERITKLDLEAAKREILDAQPKSPYRMPWKRPDLQGQPDSEALFKIFDEIDDAERTRLTSTVPLADAMNQLRAAASESQGGGALATLRLEIDEPEVRGAGTANARIVVRGRTTGVPDGKFVRAQAELRFPTPDAMPALAKAMAVIEANRFTIELKIDRRTLLLGRYFVRVVLDYGKVRDKTPFMVNGSLVPVLASRAAFVGIHEADRNDPDNAPEVIAQDIETKLWYFSLLRGTLLSIGDAEHPESSPDRAHWEAINRGLEKYWAEQVPAGIVPLGTLLAELRTKNEEMQKYFDEVAWRKFLDERYFASLTAARQRVVAYEDQFLRLRYPEYGLYLLGEPTGIFLLMQEYAVVLSKALYEKAGKELPPSDAERLRAKGRTVDSCFDLINHNMKAFNDPTKGVSEPALVAAYRKLAAKSAGRGQ